MRADFRFELTKDEYVVGLGTLIERLGAQDRTRPYMLLEMIALVAVAIVALTALFPGDATGIVAAVLALPVAEAAVRSRAARRATGASYDPAVAACELQFRDDEITEQAAGRLRRWRWSEVRAVHDKHSAVVVELAGWDMLVLPARLWSAPVDKQVFVDQAQALLPAAAADAASAPVATIASRDMMLLGAIGAAANAFMLVTTLTPLEQSLTLALLGLGMAAVAAAFAYRLAQVGLGALHAQSQLAAQIVAHALVWAIPIYMVGVYFGLA